MAGSCGRGTEPSVPQIGGNLLTKRGTICRIKDQLDVACDFISLLTCSTCFGH